MDVREKLIDLIIDAKRTDPETGRFTEYLADYLVSNGVTVNEWIPVDDRLPEIGEIVLACGKRHATSGMFQGASIKNPKLWNWKGNTLKQVTHWMPLPQPPKGE